MQDRNLSLNRFARRAAAGLTAVVIATAAAVGVASPAFAGPKSGGYYACPPYQAFVVTFNRASGTVTQEQKPNGVWYGWTLNNQPLATRTWHGGWGPTIQGWYVYGSYQNDAQSGAGCSTY